METDLGEIHGGIIIIAELQRHLVLGCHAVVHIVQRNLKGIIFPDLETQDVSIKTRGAPIPSFDRELSENGIQS